MKRTTRKNSSTAQIVPYPEEDPLIEGERISFDEDVTKPNVSDEEINSRYAKGEARFVTEQARYPLAGIQAMLNEEIDGENGRKERRYQLDPEYQRRHRWDDVRKSRLIESFLMNVPVPPIFLYERDLARFEVMDGRQRLTSLSDFYANNFKLTGLQYWPELDGRTYAQLPSRIRDGIDRRYISSIILLKETATDATQAEVLKKVVFERLNLGGVKFGSQEIRNAVYGGPLNALCLSASANENFQRMWGIPIDKSQIERDGNDESDDSSDESTNTGTRMYEKMEDVELVLRFFAYRQMSAKYNTNRMSEFLDRFISQGNKFDQAVLDEYKTMFEDTVAFLWDVLGTEAFTVLGSSKRPIKIVYDALMYVANSCKMRRHRVKLTAKKDVLRSQLEEMYTQNRDLFAGRRTNHKDAKDRNYCVAEAFAKAIKISAK